jgi:hypothetical protein
MENCTQKTTIPTKSKTKPLIIASDFNGNVINFNQDGWFNATEVAAAFGKRPVDWLSLDSTQQYIKDLAEHIRSEKSSLLKIKRGGRGKSDSTWMHPKLAIRFAQWLDSRFAIWCDAQIESIIYGDKVEQRLKENELMKLFISQKHDAHKEMMDALVQARAEEGKITNAKHFINENRLCNWAVLGKFESVDEVHLSQLDALLLAFARLFNEGFINACIDYATRKLMLLNAIEKKRHALVKKLNTATALAKVAL